MNVLSDRHHSGLYHSLQLLAERLGWTLYTPIGHEWWDAGYWDFGHSTYNDDRLAQQFLVGVAGPDGLGAPPDGEFPDWPINAVTLDQARVMNWAFVIATVPDNEDGMARFADAMGARFIVQVGNTGQFVNWRRDPLVLSSSEMPILGRGVVYHQEIDAIAYHPPKHRGTAASFVNCMPFMGTCWVLLQEAQGLGLPIYVYGIDGPDGIIKPNTALVELMAAVDWGWHDKQQGDGFGHVIHTWAAVGRPLIGHGSHYRGKMGERFWKDGVTCIDLDKHSIAETVEMIGKMCRCRHEDMSMAIRAEFDEIDYAGEAETIRAFLA
jgi:hypothetical protein